MVIYTDGCIYNHGTYMGLNDHVTTKQFLGKILYFKANKKHELAFKIVFNMWQTIVQVKL